VGKCRLFTRCASHELREHQRVKEALRRDQRGTIRASTTDEPRQRFQCFGCEKKWREVSKRRFCPYCKQPLVMRMGDA
jgi:hypothetical protein